MKSYVTSGTGSQQTLTGSQDEKVAVYQTLADAEADLANLEAGQIVATPDTGDEYAQPVDVIQAGNMHAVTSNAVATSNAMPVDEVTVNNVHSVTSNAVYKKHFITPTTSNNLPTSSDEINFYKLNWGTNISIAGVKQVLDNYGFHNKTTGTSIVELVGNGGQRATVILSHSGVNYYAGVIITFYFTITYIHYNNGTWD